METTFKMFIGEHTEEYLIAALEYVKNTPELSRRVNVEIHSVTYKKIDVKGSPNNSKRGVWYEITVSRPFLIFLIGQRFEKEKASFYFS